jgi:hypothetical protein
MNATAQSIDVLDEDLEELPEWVEPLDVPSRRRTPYDRLLLAVLRESITDLRSGHRHPERAAAARAFFADTSDGDGLHFSFEQICEHFGFNPDVFRTQVLPRLRKRLPPGKRRPRL